MNECIARGKYSFLMAASLAWTPWPTLEVPSEEQQSAIIKNHGSEVLIQLHEAREEKIRRESTSPYEEGYYPDHWKDADKLLETHDNLLISGGNRSGKTCYSCRKLVDVMINKPGARVVAFSMTNQSSVRDLQPTVYKYLPSGYKGKRRNSQVSYTQKNGFTNSSAVLPNGSAVYFHFYEQRSDILEGLEADLIYFDELVSMSWIDTAQYRLVTRKGKMLIAATPITGWTPTVNKFLSGAQIVKTRPSPLLPDKVNVTGCPVGTMPYIAECVDDSSAAMFFHTDLNPYNPMDQMERTLTGETSVNVKIRAYGWAERTTGAWFPKFNKGHIVAPSEVPDGGTRYHSIDPHGARSWAMIWMKACMVDGEERWFVYDEYPRRSEFGEWAVPGDADMAGKEGPAQTPVGNGITMYRDVIKEQEKSDEIFVRVCDPRAGGTRAMSDDGLTLIEKLNDGDDPLNVDAAPGLHIEQGVGAINEALDYSMEEDISFVNRPKLMISSRCGNLIDCLQEASPAGGEKNSYKDFIDCLRYLITYNPEYVSDSSYAAVGGGTY